MTNHDNWAEAMQREVESWHVENPEHPIQRAKFLRVVAVEEITTWEEFQGLLRGDFGNMSGYFVVNRIPIGDSTPLLNAQ